MLVMVVFCFFKLLTTEGSALYDRYITPGVFKEKQVRYALGYGTWLSWLTLIAL
jgi:hypothetical protein